MALIASLSGLLTGCASPFERFYKPAPQTHGATVTPSDAPLVGWSGDLDQDAKILAQEGYVLIGTSHFQGAAIESAFGGTYEQQAIAEARRVGAAVVLLNVDSHVVVGNAPDFGVNDAGDPRIKMVASYWAKADHADR